MSLPLSPPTVRRTTSTVDPSTIGGLLVAGGIFGLPVVGIGDVAAGLTAGPMFLLWAMAAVTPLAVYGIARLSRLQKGGPRAMLCLVALAGLVTGEIIAANAITGDDGQRCVQVSTMLVVARSQCENQNPATPADDPGAGLGNPDDPTVAWYYGGTTVGGTDQDGSFYAPGTEAPGGSGSGGGGGGEDGGDGGDGGEGGGGGGGGGD
jgi:hypothetical protein